MQSRIHSTRKMRGPQKFPQASVLVLPSRDGTCSQVIELAERGGDSTPRLNSISRAVNHFALKSATDKHFKRFSVVDLVSSLIRCEVDYRTKRYH